MAWSLNASTSYRTSSPRVRYRHQPPLKHFPYGEVNAVVSAHAGVPTDPLCNPEKNNLVLEYRHMT